MRWQDLKGKMQAMFELNSLLIGESLYKYGI